MPKTIQSFTVGGPDLNKANWWTNTSPSRAQMAAAASMGATGMLGGGVAGNMVGSPHGVPRFGTFSNWATQQALADQHAGLTALHDQYQAAMSMGDVKGAEKALAILQKYGFDPNADRPIFQSPYVAPTFVVNPGQPERPPARRAKKADPRAETPF